jgi:membrane-associated phospholipid phosphatase
MMSSSPTLPERISRLAAYEKAFVVLSVLTCSFLLIDPLVHGVVRDFTPETRNFFRSLTNLGKSNWILVLSGTLILVFTWMAAKQVSRKQNAAYRLAQQLLLYLFSTVAISGVGVSLLKNILGRARPKYFETLGPVEFQPFTFDHSFASFPSGHATTTGALVGVLAIIWPGARVPLFVAGAWLASTRFLIDAHYFSDAVAGGAIGLASAYLLRDRLARRDWLFRKYDDGSIKLRGRGMLTSATRSLISRVEALGGELFERVKPGKGPRQ